MKRKVRIYKDPNSQGGYINKTAQWLNKAQEGIETGMTPVTSGIMQQMQPSQSQQMMQQQSAQQDPKDQILSVVVQLINQGYGEDDIKDYLLTNVYGFDEKSEEYATYEPQVLDFVSTIYEKLNSEEENKQETLANEPNTDFVADTNTYEPTQDNQDDQMINDIIYDDNEARYGGAINKRSYINKLVRKLKKAQEGDQVEEANTANVRGTEDNPTTDSPGNKNPFIAGVKGQAENHFLKKQAEEMYNNHFNQGMSQPENNIDHAQFGGWRMRRANRAAFGTPFVPPGASAKYKFGLLGGLRSAEVQFNPLMMSSMFPMMTFPGMGGYSGFGYNQPYKKISKGRLVTERIAATVNNQSIKDVADSTNSEAANNAAVGTGSGGTGSGGTGSGGTGSGPFPIDGAEQAMELKNKKDQWGRPIGSKWYGFDPDTKQWTEGVPKWFTEQKSKEIKKDKWGRPETSIWYGFDEKTKKYTEGEFKGKTVKEKEKLIFNEMKNSPEVKKLNAFYSKPQAAQAYDEFWQTAATMGAGSAAGKAGKEALSLGDDAIKFTWKNLYKNPNLLQQGTKGIGYTKGLPYTKALSYTKGLPYTKALPAPYGTQLKFVFPPYADGGFVNNPMQDQLGNLQKFIYGDEVDDQMLQDLYQPPINQSDLNYSDSEDTTDAYFRNGGLYRFQGTEDSETNPKNTSKTYTQEELDKLIADKQKSWETDYQKKYNQQMQGQTQMMQGFGGYGGGYNPYDSYSAWSSRGNYGGFGPYASTGLLGAAGNLIKGFGRGPSTYGPAGNPLQYAATAAAITNSGMLPTGMRYSKEKGSGLLGKLGLRNDKVWTLDYATPEQIKAGIKPSATNSETNPNVSNMSFRDNRIARRDERLNRNIPAESDAYQFTGTLTGSPESSAKEPLSNEEMLKAQGKVWDEKEQKWIKNPELNNVMSSPTPGIAPSQGANIVTGNPGTPVNLRTATPVSPGMTGKTQEEIKRAIMTGTAIPTVANKGNTTIINAGGEPIDLNDSMYSEYAYGGYVPNYMAYGGYLPTADNGINFSSISYAGNPVIGVEESPTWAAMHHFNNQNENIKNPNANKFKNYTIEPEGDDLSNCTDEQKLDPTSKCYQPQTAQLKIKEEKGKIDPSKVSRGVLDFGANLADAKDYMNERKNKYIPGMTEFSMGEKQSANEVVNRGEWNARTGKEGIQGFQGIIKKGGAIKNKKSNTGGHKINISDFQDLMRLAGLK